MKRLIRWNLLVILLLPLATSTFGANKKNLQYFIEKEAIENTVNELFLSTDNRNWPGVLEVFANQVWFDMSSLTQNPPSTIPATQIVKAWEEGLKKLNAIHHQTGNYQVTINGNEADVFCYGTASHYLPNKTNRNTRVFVGSYNFHLIKTGEKWEIDKFKFNFKYMEGNPNLEANL